MVERFRLQVDDAVFDIELDEEKVLVNGQPFYVIVNGDMVQVDGRPHKVELEGDKALVDGIAYQVRVEEKVEEAGVVREKKRPVEEAAGEGALRAIMPGKIIAVKVKEGDRVSKGDILCVLEAMKMENELRAPKAGTVKEVRVSPGADVEMGEVLVVVE